MCTMTLHYFNWDPKFKGSVSLLQNKNNMTFDIDHWQIYRHVMEQHFEQKLSTLKNNVWGSLHECSRLPAVEIYKYD